MADEDSIHDAVERLEWDERKEDETPSQEVASDDAPHRAHRWSRRNRRAGPRGLWRQQQQRPSTSSAASGGGSSAAASIFGSSKSYKFTFVNHVTTNPFFTPTQNGAADACKLLGCSYQWTGSDTSNVSQMVNAMNSAVTAGVDGIAIALIDTHAFNAPTTKALAAGIPVVAYNADVHGQRPAGVHRPGPVRVGAGDGRSTSRSSSRPETSRCSSPRRVRSTSSRGSTARRTRSRATRRSPRTPSRPGPRSRPS